MDTPRSLRWGILVVLPYSTIGKGRPHYGTGVRGLPPFPIRIRNRIAVDGRKRFRQAAGGGHVGELAGNDGAGLPFRAVINKSGAAAHQLRGVGKLQRIFRQCRRVDEIAAGRAGLLISILRNTIRGGRLKPGQPWMEVVPPTSARVCT